MLSSPNRRSSRRIGAAMLFTRRRFLLFLVDIAALTVAFCAAYALRFDFAIPDDYRYAMWRQLPWVVGLQVVVLAMFGIPRFIWRYVSLREVQAFAGGTAVAAIPLLVLRAVPPYSGRLWQIPVSVILLDAILAFGGLLTLRAVRRLTHDYLDRREKQRKQEGAAGARKRVLLVGAGKAGVLAVREFQGREDFHWDVVGFVDDDPIKQGMTIHGVPVLGSTRDLSTLASALDIDQAVLTIAEPDPPTLERLKEACKVAELPFRVIPGFYEVLQGRVSVDRFQAIPPEDLLQRDTVRLDSHNVRRYLGGRRVMVTGAGGSIGSELARQVADAGPESLVLLERAEFALFDIHREVQRRCPDVDSHAIVADVGDGKRMRTVFRTHRPEVVLHAAAHKHVPLMEFNVAEAVRNNILATRTLARQSGEFGVESFVLVSTDKAVRPSSVMGATKRFAELVCQQLDQHHDTAYVAVRFGNVLGSVGSVIPIFEEQIRAGGPVTVTHPGMRRYFMTIPEAVSLVLEAGAMGKGSEIFVLDMGEPVRIVDLAERLIELHGYRPNEDIEIVFTGIRPGEKLFEELGEEVEELVRTDHPKIFVGRIPTCSDEELEAAMVELDAFAIGTDPATICGFLEEFLSGLGLGAGGLGANGGDPPERAGETVESAADTGSDSGTAGVGAMGETA